MCGNNLSEKEGVLSFWKVDVDGEEWIDLRCLRSKMVSIVLVKYGWWEG